MVRISDEEIINILIKNARTPVLQIARMLNVNEGTVRKRIQKLEKEGVIEGYTIEVNPKKLGYEVVALIGIDTTPERYLSVIENLREDPIVKRAYSSAGDHMIMVECWFHNQSELSEYLRDLESREGVTRVCPAILIERIK